MNTGAGRPFRVWLEKTTLTDNTETSDSKPEEFTIPWTAGPWFTGSGFRHIQARVSKGHPLQDWPDCDPDATEGPFACDSEEKPCTCLDMCKDEWENCNPIASITYVPNPPGVTQADQILGHPQVKANVDLITLAPDMADVILAWRENWDETKGVEPDCPILRDVWNMADELKTCGNRPF